MAAEPVITGAPTRAPAFADFDMTRMDDISSTLDQLKSLIWVAIDIIGSDAYHAENLLHAALTVQKAVDDQASAVHSDLLSIRLEESNA